MTSPNAIPRPLLALLFALITFSAANAQSSGNVSANGDQDAVQLGYTGSNTRVGLGFDDDGHGVGELLHVFGSDDDSAWIGEGWFNDSAGGVKLNYHWSSQPDRVYKAFLAVDQNRDHDRKATLGGGIESEALFWSGYVSGAITGARHVDTTVDIDELYLLGVEDERDYQQLQTTTTTTLFFEHPYDSGLGMKVGTFMEESLWRIRSGIDYEKGHFNSKQMTLSVGVEKFFRNTGHSLSLTAEHLKKRGDFEVVDSDNRAALVWRYDFGKRYSPKVAHHDVETPRTVPAVAAKTEMQLVRNRVNVDANTFFNLDRATLRPKSVTTIENIVARITQGEIVGKVSVVGHTCDLGPRSYNQGLSERRAATVADKMIASGIDTDAILSEGRGEDQPKHENSTEETRKLNRRVDIQFLTLEESRQEVVVTPAKAQHQVMEWTREVIPGKPQWLQRALRNPVAHKRTVDVYRYQEEEVEVALGEREYFNRPPVAQADTATMMQDGEPLVIDVLANDSDPDGNPITIVAVTQPEQGSVDNFGDIVIFTPGAGSNGVSQFEYTISDGEGGEATAQVSVDVVNQSPIAVGDSVTTTFETAVTIAVLENDNDPEGDPLTLTSVEEPAHGTVTINGENLVYTPADGYTGSDSFSYTVDATGGTATAVVTITIDPIPPLAVNDTASAFSGISKVIDVLANDTSAMGGNLTLVAVGIPNNGTAAIDGDRIAYTAQEGYVGNDSFTYTILEADGLQATATVSVTVEAPNSAPVAADDSASTDLQDPVTISVLDNDSDPEGDPITIMSVDDPVGGSVVIDGDNLVYTADEGFSGIDSFTYTIEALGGTSSATVTVTVYAAPNQAPNAENDEAFTPLETPVTVDVLANDSDPDGDTLTVIAVGDLPSPVAEITINADNTITFSPLPTWTGSPISFTYTISDGRGGTATAYVTVKC